MNNKYISTDKRLYKCFCKNCGEKGHIYRSCNMPITSIGIIVYHYDSFEQRYKFLLIKRRDSLGYVDFLRGKYNVNSDKHVLNLVNEMTNNEKKLILNQDFSELWKKLWNNNSEKIDVVSKTKFDTLRNGFQTNINLEDIVKQSNTSWDEPEWGFPKGRRNNNEKDYSAALREFNEETGISIDKLIIIQNIKPFEECFIGSNFKAYKHKYYLAKLNLNKGERIEDAINLYNFQKSEVSEVNFFTYDECIEKFRNYNKERVIILSDVHDLLKNEIIE